MNRQHKCLISVPSRTRLHCTAPFVAVPFLPLRLGTIPIPIPLPRSLLVVPILPHITIIRPCTLQPHAKQAATDRGGKFTSAWCTAQEGQRGAGRRPNRRGLPQKCVLLDRPDRGTRGPWSLDTTILSHRTWVFTSLHGHYRSTTLLFFQETST